MFLSEVKPSVGVYLNQLHKKGNSCLLKKTHIYTKAREQLSGINLTIADIFIKIPLSVLTKQPFK